MEKQLNIVNPDYLSRTTQQLIIGFEETGNILSTATGFLYSLNKYTYLITNWHNVTGRNPVTGETVSENNGGIPNFFLTYLRVKNGGGASEREEILLYEDEEMTKPKWLIHPVHKEQVDVVAIKLVKSERLIYTSINDADFEKNIEPEVGDECFVIGYPFEDLRYLGLPIWKKASIASEPTVNEDQLPKILIDTATRPGLSGSPVIFQRNGVHNSKNNELTLDTIFGRIRGFLGVYSGRIGKGEINAQLGIVWKKKVIDEIINGNIYGDIEFQKGKKKNGL